MDNVSFSVVPVSASNSSTPLVENKKLLGDFSIWNSAESGYYTTPGSNDNSITNVRINVNFSTSASYENKAFAAFETPKCRGSTRPRKRASSLTDMIDNHLQQTTLPNYDSGFLKSRNEESFCVSSYDSLVNNESCSQRKRYCQQNNSQWILETLPEEQNNTSILENEFDESSYFEFDDPSKTHEPGNENIKIEPIILETLQNKYCGSSKNICKSKSCPVTPIKQSKLNKCITTLSSNSLLKQDHDQCENVIVYKNDISTTKSPIKRLFISAESEKNDILYHSRPVTPPKSSNFNIILTPNKNKINRSKRRLSSAKVNLEVNHFDKIDIMDKLAKFDLVWAVLKFLLDDDLCRFCMVSKRWRDICLKDSRASKRRSKYLLDKRLNKENYTSIIKKANDNNETMNHMRNVNNRKEFLEIQNSNDERVTSIISSCSMDPDHYNINKSPPVSPKRATLLKFVKAGKKLGPQKCLKKCPKCSGPAHPLSKKSVKLLDPYLYEKSTQESIKQKENKKLTESCSGTIYKSKKIITSNKLNATCSPGDGARIEKNASIVESCSKLNEKNLNNKSSISKNEMNSLLDKLYNSSSNSNIFFEQEAYDPNCKSTSSNNTNKLYTTTDKFDNRISHLSNGNCSNLNNQNMEYCCDSLHCGYSFCNLCLGPAHLNGICSQTELRMQAYSPPRLPQENENYRSNTKKIKKSLRRL